MNSELIADFEPALGPNWEEGRAIAKAFMEKFEAEQFKPLLEKFTDKFRDVLWTDVECFMMGDNQSNIGREVGRRVDECVKAILMGDRRLIDFYALESHNSDLVRAAVVAAIPREIQDARVAELEAEVKRLNEQIRYTRER